MGVGSGAWFGSDGLGFMAQGCLVFVVVMKLSRSGFLPFLGALLGYWRHQHSEELACGGSLNLCRSCSIKRTMSKRVTIAER